MSWRAGIRDVTGSRQIFPLDTLKCCIYPTHALLILAHKPNKRRFNFSSPCSVNFIGFSFPFSSASESIKKWLMQHYRHSSGWQRKFDELKSVWLSGGTLYLLRPSPVQGDLINVAILAKLSCVNISLDVL